jgi:hypothetical protein
LEISNVRWDGECLRFVSLFAPTNHKAKHALRLIGNDKISHRVIHYSEERPCTDDERRSPPSGLLDRNNFGFVRHTSVLSHK